MLYLQCFKMKNFLDACLIHSYLDAKVAKLCGNQNESTNDGLRGGLASCPSSLVKYPDFTWKDQAPRFQLMRL